jgi:hypothetical protein
MGLDSCHHSLSTDSFLPSLIKNIKLPDILILETTYVKWVRFLALLTDAAHIKPPDILIL